MENKFKLQAVNDLSYWLRKLRETNCCVGEKNKAKNFKHTTQRCLIVISEILKAFFFLRAFSKQRLEKY